jgi:Immunity protein 17
MPFWASIFFVLAGMFSLAGAIFEWEWFMSNYRARSFVRSLGRDGARGLYALLGIFLIGLGVAGAFGLLT